MRLVPDGRRPGRTEQARTLAEELGGSATALGPNDPLGGEVVVSPSATRDQGRRPRVRRPGRGQGRSRHHEPGRCRDMGRPGHTGRNVLRRGGRSAPPG